MKPDNTQRPTAFSVFSQDNITMTGFTTAFVLTLAQWLIILIYIWQLPPEVPLFYSFPVGDDQLADKYWLLIIPTISTLSLILWWALFYFSRRVISVFHHITSWFTALIALVGAVSLLHIIILIY